MHDENAAAGPEADPPARRGRGPGRGPRVDAVRNRARIVRSAQDVFTRDGTAASMRDVAAAAGVGLGTVYRHFPDKDALLQAVLEERFRLLTEQTRLASETLPPWPAFVRVMRLIAQMMTEDRAFAGSAGDRRREGGRPAAGRPPGPTEARRELDETLLGLAERARAAGELRADVGERELGLVVGGIGMALSRPPGRDGGPGPGTGVGTSATVGTPGADGQPWERFLEIALDGLRERSRGNADR